MEWSFMKRHFILSFGVGFAICVLVVGRGMGADGNDVRTGSRNGQVRRGDRGSARDAAQH